jgi:phage-related minor tail protein
MQNLTLVKAAGAASQLSPELAVVAYGFGAVISATLSNVEDKLLTLSKKKKSVAHEKPHTDTKLSQNQRNELIVHRYILAQLHSVEEAQRNRKLLAMKLAKVASVKGKKRIIRDSTAEGEDDNKETTATTKTKVPIVFTREPSTEVTDNPMRSTTSIEEGEI